MLMDMTADSRNGRLLVEQRRLLAMIGSSAPLDHCLSSLCDTLPQLSGGIRAGVLLSEGSCVGTVGDLTQADFAQCHPHPGERITLTAPPQGGLDVVADSQPISCVDITHAAGWSPRLLAWCQAQGIRGFHAQPVFSAQGQTVALLVLWFDQPREPSEWERRLADFGSYVTAAALERERSNQALWQSECQQRARAAELEVLLDLVPAVVCLAHDGSGQHITGSRRAYELLRVPIGSNLADYTDRTRRSFCLLRQGVELPLDQLLVHRAIDGQMVCNDELEVRFDDGTVRYLLGNAIPMRNDQEQVRGAVAVMIDITQRKQAENEMHQANRTLEQRVAERTAELEQRAHQLQIMASELADTEQRERRRLARLLHDDLQQILVAARIRMGMAASSLQTDQQSDMSAQQLVRDAKKLLTQAIDTSRSLSSALAPPVLYDLGLCPALHWLGRWVNEKYDLQVDAQLDEVDVDNEPLRVMVFEAVRELLLNVVKHAGQQVARLKVERRSDVLHVTVQDHGCGFDPQEAARRPEGHGFGLFSLQQRLRLFGGDVTIDSRPGAGTRVQLLVPLESMARPARDRQGLLPADAQLPVDHEPIDESDHPVRVMLADDHEILRRGLANLIDSQPDMELVGEASSGEEAVEQARVCRPEVVLMDISMPGISGIEATRQLTRQFPHIFVVGLSIHEERDVAEAMCSAGACAYLSKGQSSDELLATIRRLASRRSLAG